MLISAFPGMGKTYFCKNNINCLDSDSSTFDKANFPNNYIQHIKQNLNNYEYIFVSTHKQVRDTLINEGIPFTLIIPNVFMKEVFLQRFKQRNSPQSFIDLLDNNFESWVKECCMQGFQNEKLIDLIITKDEYITDLYNEGLI